MICYFNIMLITSVFLINFMLYDAKELNTLNKINQRTKRFFQDFFIIDGTVWCGKGNKAENCDHLGRYSLSDSCCREHDNCPYTFVSHQEYNGFSSVNSYTISHCECDTIFYDCLNEKPYKEKSYEIWGSFESLKVKCFAYLPCNSDDESDEINKNIIINKANRRIGKCLKGARVMVFESITDYKTYIKNNLNKEQLHLTRKYLITEQVRFSSGKKGNCSNKFIDFHDKITRHFESKFLNDDLLIEKKTIFLYHIIVPIAFVLLIFVFLKILMNLYDKDL